MKVKKLTKVTFPSYVFFLFCSIEGSFQDEKKYFRHLVEVLCANILNAVIKASIKDLYSDVLSLFTFLLRQQSLKQWIAHEIIVEKDFDYLLLLFIL